MNIIKKAWFVIAWYGLSTHAMAQIKPFNLAIEFNTGHFAVSKMRPPILNVGLGAQVKLYHNLSIGIHYQRWEWDKIFSHSSTMGRTSDLIYPLGVYTHVVGKISGQYNYRYSDAYIKYHIYKGPHNIYISAGLSRLAGYNQYFITVWQIPGYEPHFESSNLIFQTFLGPNAGLGYDFALIKSRVNIGFNITARYFTREIRQYDANLIVGYNFWKRKDKNVQLSKSGQ